MRVGAAHRAGGVDPLADLAARDLRADRRDHPGGVASRRVGQRRLVGVGAGTDVGLDRVHARGVHPDDDLTGAGRGIGHVLQAHHFRRAELVDANGFHHDVHYGFAGASGEPRSGPAGAVGVGPRWGGSRRDDLKRDRGECAQLDALRSRPLAVAGAITALAEGQEKEVALKTGFDLRRIAGKNDFHVSAAG